MISVSGPSLLAELIVGMFTSGLFKSERVCSHRTCLGIVPLGISSKETQVCLNFLLLVARLSSSEVESDGGISNFAATLVLESQQYCRSCQL